MDVKLTCTKMLNHTLICRTIVQSYLIQIASSVPPCPANTMGRKASLHESPGDRAFSGVMKGKKTPHSVELEYC